jgi:hypothetical protein
MNTDGDVVSLSTMQDLVRVADKYQSVIFWKRDGEDDTFVVQEDEARYIYRATVPVNS